MGREALRRAASTEFTSTVIPAVVVAGLVAETLGVVVGPGGPAEDGFRLALCRIGVDRG
jgi:hypothetical protein